jgi:hypothetical protein
MENKWTKFSERLPEESQEQVYMALPNGKVSTTRRNPGNPWADYYGRDLQPAAMWHPITYPELPREETQEEKDRTAMEASWRNLTWRPLVGEDYREAWNTALRYERAEAAKELANTVVGIMPDVEAVDRLRKRCGLDK